MKKHKTLSEPKQEDQSQRAVMTDPEVPRRCVYRPDCLMWGIGLIFIAALIAATFGIGAWRGWDAQSGWYHNVSVSSQKRFLPEPSDSDPYPEVRGRDGSESGGSWYYWKNKPEDVTKWSRLFVWIGYAAHQISIWVVLYIAQANKAEYGGPRAGTDLSKYNWLSFGINIFFHLLSLLKTHITYDGLAQDVLVTSSQCSVIMLLLLVMLLEYSERGLFFGWPVARHHKSKFSTKLRLNMTPIRLVRKYHGYAFSWAAIYTFWYHPMENTYGHALGFFHTWAIMLQGSLMFTKVHINRWWRLLLECWVILHGAIVALQTGEPGNPGASLWPMFTFGFLLLFCFTQIYILPFWEQIPGWVKMFPPLVYIAVTLGAYSQIPDPQGRYWVRLQEIIRIPAIEYAGFLLVWAFMYLCWYIDTKVHAKATKEISPKQRAVYLILSLFIFLVFIALSIAFQVAITPLAFFIMMVLLVFFFSLLSGLVCLLMSHTMPSRRTQNDEGYLNDSRDNSDEVSYSSRKVEPIDDVVEAPISESTHM